MKKDNNLNTNKFIKSVWLIMDELQSADQMENALQSILEKMCVEYSCSDASLWLKHDGNQRLYMIASKGNEDNTGLSIAFDEGVIGEVFSTGDTITVSENEKDLFEKDHNIHAPNALIVPLKTPYGVLGCMAFSGKETAFDEDEIRIIENCSALIALDLEDKGFSFDVDLERKPLVSLRGIIKEFMSGEELNRILKGIDLDVYEGELLVVLGESGCGKSTMLNIIGGMDKATEGQLIIEGKDFSDPSEKELTDYRRDYIGFIFQSYNLMPNLTALENIEFIAEISQNPLDSSEALEMVGLGDRADRYPSALSGGQQQRVCIARAIVKDPKIILADEPTAALDFNTGQGVLKVIEKIVKERNTTVIMVTHNVEIAKMANRVIKLRNGNISSIRTNFHPMKAEDLVW
ncbi:MAG: ATP-binding cassette domain-containing protein [Erysipelotrichaceae bacterium]|nr:ATP-binding cassette domain-containing protein [Erysipelotrichaceae bacterium]